MATHKAANILKIRRELTQTTHDPFTIAAEALDRAERLQQRLAYIEQQVRLQCPRCNL